jgi:hypothetical protein
MQSIIKSVYGKTDDIAGRIPTQPVWTFHFARLPYLIYLMVNSATVDCARMITPSPRIFDLRCFLFFFSIVNL